MKLGLPKEIVNAHIPELLTLGGFVRIFLGFSGKKPSPRDYLRLYELTGEENYKIRHLQLTKSNNWLRLHGYPMRKKDWVY